jgi:ATP-dependent DNA helicase RecQ
MDVIRQYPLTEVLKNNFSDTINETLTLHQDGLSIDAIADKRDLSTGTIYSHLADVIEAGMLSAPDVLNLEDNDIILIERTAELLKSKEENALKPLFDELEGEFEYGVLRCVVSGL